MVAERALVKLVLMGAGSVSAVCVLVMAIHSVSVDGMSQARLAELILAGVAGFAAVVAALTHDSLLRLRVVEIAIVASLAVFIGVHGYDAISSITPSAAPTAWTSTVLYTVILIGGYGVLVPNSWLRAAGVIFAITTVPITVLALVWNRLPEQAAALNEMGVASSVAILLIAAAISVLGALLMAAFRNLAIKTRVMDMYDLIERIGEGGMGEVWRAEHQRLARPAAIKIIRKDRLEEYGDEAHKLLDRFQLEAQATAQLRSPNTVEVYDFGTTQDGTFYYVMEYLDGFDLEDLVEDFGPQPAERVIYLMSQACESLGDAHERGLVHRDIKPANIYVSHLGLSYDFVKVLDFGLARPIPKEGQELKQSSDGVISGTPAYMAPEMISDDYEVDHRVDIYALGCVAYWLVTGELVFDADNVIKMALAHTSQKPIRPSKRTEIELPAELDALILRCLEKNPADRFASVRELAEAFAAVPIKHPWNSKRAETWWTEQRGSTQLSKSSASPSEQELANATA